MNKIIDLETDELHADNLRMLCSGEIMAIRISDFIAKEVIDDVRERLFHHNEKGALGHAKEFTRLGISYAEIKNDDVRIAYHANALKNIQRLRNLFGTKLSPIDRFRVLLDDIWPTGAHLLSVNNEKCFVGVCRYLTPGIDLKPHIDNLEWTLPAGMEFKIKHQLSSNIYLQVPEKGGELELWNISPSAKEYDELKGTRHYGIDRSLMPIPEVVIKPRSGDLIFLNPRFIHSVRPVEHVDRITLSSFIGIESDNTPLVYWS